MVAATSSPAEIRIVGVGASAGGLDALQQFLGEVREGGGFAFVIVQHQHPDHVPMLAALLQQHCVLPVRLAGDAIKVAADTVYVIAPDREITITGGWLFQRTPDQPRGRRMPIDSFLRSLAWDQGSHGVGVVLSGMGDDGTRGLQAIHSEQGLTMAQEPASAKFPSMPSSAIRAGVCDVVASPAMLGRQLAAAGHAAAAQLLPPPDQPAAEETPVHAIVRLLRQHGRHDFTHYKQSTFRRRCERRMSLHGLVDLAGYARFLAANAAERDLLSKEVLIGVTAFFRDAEVWAKLRATVLPELLARHDAAEPLRTWVVGCSTGEEAYSLAMVYRELADASGGMTLPVLQVFATDLSADAIAFARRGLYAAAALHDVAPERVARFFSKEGDSYRVRPELREMVLFTQHNVIDDPPFTRLDLISCRNLLIYFTAPLQQRLLPLFHYALRPSSVLVLGESESVGAFRNLFAPLDAARRIYLRSARPEGSNSVTFPVSRGASSRQGTHAHARTRISMGEPDNLQSIVEQRLLKQFAPAAVLVNEAGDILFVHGRTGRYLQPAAGRANWNIHAMAHTGIRAHLGMALRRALHDRSTVELPRLTMEESAGAVEISVTPLENPESVTGMALVVFRDVPADSPSQASDSTAPDGALTQELARCQAEIRALREEMRASAEEVQATHEELQSANEELQSANEELTTSKEEAQSMNEELHTINAELQSRVDDLALVQSDMQNLLNSTAIATLFLDGALNVRRFTEHMQHIVNLREADVGRPLSDLANKLVYPELERDATETLRTLAHSEKEIPTSDGQWFSVRIMPYRTVTNVIQGVVITFIDITAAKQLEERLRRRDGAWASDATRKVDS